MSAGVRGLNWRGDELCIDDLPIARVYDTGRYGGSRWRVALSGSAQLVCETRESAREKALELVRATMSAATLRAFGDELAPSVRAANAADESPSFAAVRAAVEAGSVLRVAHARTRAAHAVHETAAAAQETARIALTAARQDEDEARHALVHVVQGDGEYL